MNKDIQIAQVPIPPEHDDSMEPESKQSFVIHEHRLVGKINHTNHKLHQQHANNLGAKGDQTQAGLYDIDGKISFLEPEISEQLAEARLYQQEIGLLDDNLKSSARRSNKSPVKSSNYAG